MGSNSFLDNVINDGKQRRDKNAEEQRVRDAETKLQAEETAFQVGEDKKAFDKKEDERMGENRTRTLLTGGKGLDDEDLNVSRKKLMGF